MDNKERIEAFVKGFGSMALTLITLIACAGSLNYGVECGKHLYTIFGAIGAIWKASVFIKFFFKKEA